MSDEYNLTQLGQTTELPASPDQAVLEAVPNPQHETDYVVRLSCPEFTSLCPITGQPDFAHFVIDYIPDALIVESKSLKLFMASFRNHAAFHEDCSVYVAKRLEEALSPKWLRLGAHWYPRGGIPIDVFYQTSEPPEGPWIPEPAVSPYKARS